LIHFPHFPAGTKSLLSKHLTQEIWEKYKDKKDKFGLPFKLCVFSGCQNVDSGVGVYASSHDAYYAFEEFFDRIVEAYHGVKHHVKEIKMDSAALHTEPFEEEDAKMIISTRIRTGRNLAEFPLGPGITNE
jgi:creatine kinase/arginine kinase